MIAYQTFQGEYGRVIYDPIKLTGRWKLVTNAIETNALYLEKQGWLFKRWLHEDYIVIRPEETQVIFECTNIS